MKFVIRVLDIARTICFDSKKLRTWIHSYTAIVDFNDCDL